MNIHQLKNYNLLLNYSIIGYSLSLSISKASTVAFSLLMIIFWLLEGNFKKKYEEFKRSSFIKALIFFLIISCIYIIFAPDKIFALEFVKKYWHFLPLFVIFNSVNKQYINVIFASFLIGIFISGVFSFGIHYELFQYKNIPSYDPTPFMDHMNYSTFLAFSALLVLNKLFFIENRKLRIFYLLLFIFIVFILFINAGRTGQVIFLVVFLFVSFLKTKEKIKTLSFVSLLSFMIVLTAYNTSVTFQERSDVLISDVKNLVNGDFSGSFGHRVALWIIGTNIFKDNIFLGTGIGNELEGFSHYAHKYKFETYMHPKYDTQGTIDFHSSFVQYAAQLGIFGLIIFISIFYFLFTLNFKSQYYRNLNIIFVSIFVLHSFVFYSFHVLNPISLFALFTPIFAKISYLDEKKLTV